MKLKKNEKKKHRKRRIKPSNNKKSVANRVLKSKGKDIKRYQEFLKELGKKRKQWTEEGISPKEASERTKKMKKEWWKKLDKEKIEKKKIKKAIKKDKKKGLF